jgi:hypothetical protein
VLLLLHLKASKDLVYLSFVIKYEMTGFCCTSTARLLYQLHLQYWSKFEAAWWFA